MAPEAEGVRQGHIHPPLDLVVGGVVQVALGVGVEWLMVGGMTPQVATRSDTPNSSAPAPPSRWPVIDLVEPEHQLARLLAEHGLDGLGLGDIALHGVDVPCALM